MVWYLIIQLQYRIVYEQYRVYCIIVLVYVQYGIVWYSMEYSIIEYVIIYELYREQYRVQQNPNNIVVYVPCIAQHSIMNSIVCAQHRAVVQRFLKVVIENRILLSLICELCSAALRCVALCSVLCCRCYPFK